MITNAEMLRLYSVTNTKTYRLRVTAHDVDEAEEIASNTDVEEFEDMGWNGDVDTQEIETPRHTRIKHK